MAEYIEREALLKAYLDLALAKSKAAKARKGAAVFQGDLFPMVELTEKEWVRLINAAPAADVVEVRHGQWEPRMQDDGYGEYLLYFCSKCGAVSPNSTRNYCQNCGAKMRVGEEEKLERHSKEDGE